MFTIHPMGAPRIGLLPFPGPFPYSPKQVFPTQLTFLVGDGESWDGGKEVT